MIVKGVVGSIISLGALGTVGTGGVYYGTRKTLEDESKALINSSTVMTEDDKKLSRVLVFPRDCSISGTNVCKDSHLTGFNTNYWDPKSKKLGEAKTEKFKGFKTEDKTNELRKHCESIMSSVISSIFKEKDEDLFSDFMNFCILLRDKNYSYKDNTISKN